MRAPRQEAVVAACSGALLGLAACFTADVGDGAERGRPAAASRDRGGAAEDPERSDAGGDPKDANALDADDDASTAMAPTAERVCVDTINAFRATRGLPELARWSSAESCASTQAESDKATGKAHGAFGRCKEVAQNECPGWPGPPEAMIRQCLRAMWGEGPGGGHYENMASTRFTRVACGFSSGKAFWSVQDFR